MGSEIGFPFQGELYFEEETSYDNGISGGSEFILSDAVNVVRIESGDINKTLRHIKDSRVTDFSKTLVDPRLHIEFVWQPHTGTTVSDFVKRTNGDVNSYGIVVGASGDRGTSSWYHLKGCKCSTLNLSASTGENWTVSMDFSVASVATDSSDSFGGTAPSPIGNDYATFNAAGDITWTGGTSYYVTKSADITIENNIEDYYDVGSTSKKSAIPLAKDVTGSIDISMDEGGAVHWGHVTGGTDITSLVFDTGRTGNYGKITLNGGRIDSTSINQEVTGEGMFDSVPVTFKDLTFGTC